jgi:hypothetical protein
MAWWATAEAGSLGSVTSWLFPRVSESAKKMLPHDALAMLFVDRENPFVRDAASRPDFPDPPFVPTKTSRPKELQEREFQRLGATRITQIFA